MIIKNGDYSSTLFKSPDKTGSVFIRMTKDKRQGPLSERNTEV